MKKLAILNGPNLDRLGKREPSVYGRATLADLEAELRAAFAGREVELEFFQSNHEGALIDRIASLADRKFDGFVINPGGLTHTSVALRDSIAGSGLAAIEVHISNVHAREEFRHKSLTAGACVGVIAGLGLAGYRAALEFLAVRG
ncbi:MAG TPA: type II 3-dehydroquinate dehydratase [Opitutaceae bacterium]|nr:type II 3-dehydroquinate dehydratase [Opitutaceae bacterium]